MKGDVEFLREVMDFYRLHKRKIKKVLYIRSDEDILDFCSDFRLYKSTDEQRHIRHEYVCKLALILSNILGERLPDHLHARMMFALSSDSCKEYAEYVGRLKPKAFFGLFNPNINHYKGRRLAVNGMLSRLALK